MKLSKRELILLGALIILVNGYLINNIVFKPMIAKKAALIIENAELNQQLEKIQGKGSQYTDSEKQAQYIAEYEELLAKIPAAPMLPEIIDFVEVIAQADNVEIRSIQYKENPSPAQSVKPAPESDRGEIKSLDFQLTAQGSYFNLLSFLAKLENAPRIYIVNTSKFTLTKEEQAYLTVTSLPAEETVNSPPTAFAPQYGIFGGSNTILYLEISAYYVES